MIKKDILIKTITASLVVSGFMQDFENYLKTAESILYQPNVERITINEKREYPIITNGYPSDDNDDEDDKLGIEIFQSGLMHYGHKIITLIIIAPDFKYAKKLAGNFKTKLDSQLKGQQKENGLWKMYAKEDSLSPKEVVDIGSKAEIVYTIFAERMI
tara:strand:+ start:497 stop:970 length:474 start_codon:yes stop_codon:yes gene_type:complete